MLAERVRLNIVNRKMLSNAEAYLYLKKVLEESERRGTSPFLLIRTVEYLKKYSGVKPEFVEEVRRFLESKNLKPETIVMLLNNCPQSVEELLPLLELEPRFPSDQELNEIVEVLKKNCVDVLSE